MESWHNLLPYSNSVQNIAHTHTQCIYIYTYIFSSEREFLQHKDLQTLKGPCLLNSRRHATVKRRGICHRQSSPMARGPGIKQREEIPNPHGTVTTLKAEIARKNSVPSAATPSSPLIRITSALPLLERNSLNSPNDCCS